MIAVWRMPWAYRACLGGLAALWAECPEPGAQVMPELSPTVLGVQSVGHEA